MQQHDAEMVITTRNVESEGPAIRRVSLLLLSHSNWESVRWKMQMNVVLYMPETLLSRARQHPDTNFVNAKIPVL